MIGLASFRFRIWGNHENRLSFIYNVFSGPHGCGATQSDSDEYSTIVEGECKDNIDAAFSGFSTNEDDVCCNLALAARTWGVDLEGYSSSYSNEEEEHIIIKSGQVHEYSRRGFFRELYSSLDEETLRSLAQRFYVDYEGLKDFIDDGYLPLGGFDDWEWTMNPESYSWQSRCSDCAYLYEEDSAWQCDCYAAKCSDVMPCRAL